MSEYGGGLFSSPVVPSTAMSSQRTSSWQSRFVERKRKQQKVLQQFFGRLASILYDYPVFFIIGSVILTIILGVGLFPGIPRWVDGADRLYSLQNSQSRTHGDLHRLLFDEARTRNSHIIVTLSDPKEENLLKWQFASSLLLLDEIVRGIALEPLTARRVATDGGPDFAGLVLPSGSVERTPRNTIYARDDHDIIFGDLCHVRSDHECEGPVIVDFLRDAFRRTNHRQISDNTLPDLVVIDSFLVNLKSLKMHPLDLLLGGVTLQPCERSVPLRIIAELKERKMPKGLIDFSTIRVNQDERKISVQCVVGAKAALMTYSLRDSNELNEINSKWEASLISIIKGMRNYWPDLKVEVAAFRTRDDELKASTSESGDLAFVVLTFLVLLGYTTAINISGDLYQAKPYSGMAGAFAAVLGLISGMGLCCWLRLALVPTAFVCPFLILGIGVDDMFVILNSYALAFELKGKERCQTALSSAGTAITITTVTSLTSFGIGALSPYLAVRNFCIFCSAGLLFGYFYVFTIFFTTLCLENKREVARQLCCCGIPHSPKSAIPQPKKKKGPSFRPSEETEEYLFNQITAMVDNFLSPKNGHRGVASVEPKGNVGRMSRTIILKYYGHLLESATFKVAVLVFFVGIIAAAIYGILHLERGLDLTELAPPTSYLRQFDQAMNDWINTYDLPTDIFFPNGETEWWSPAFRGQVEQLTEKLLSSGVALRIINPLGIITGDPHYRPWMISDSRHAFENALYSAVADPRGVYYSQHRQNFLWQGRHLRAWKMIILPPFMTSSQERANWMVKLRQVCGKNSVYLTETNSQIISPAIPWNYMMHYHESDLRVIFFVAVEMSTAGTTLAIVTFLGLPDILSGAIVTAVMAMIDLTIIGFMYFWSIKLNMISMVNLLISIGFAIDYSTHVAHTFLECKGKTRSRRSIEALVLMGNPVLHGAIASVLGIGMLGFSKSHIFQIFFKMMTLIVLFGVAYGAVFMPVLLSLIGTFKSHEETSHEELCHEKRKVSQTEKTHNRLMLTYTPPASRTSNWELINQLHRSLPFKEDFYDQDDQDDQDDYFPALGKSAPAKQRISTASRLATTPIPTHTPGTRLRDREPLTLLPILSKTVPPRRPISRMSDIAPSEALIEFTPSLAAQRATVATAAPQTVATPVAALVNQRPTMITTPLVNQRTIVVTPVSASVKRVNTPKMSSFLQGATKMPISIADKPTQPSPFITSPITNSPINIYGIPSTSPALMSPTLISPTLSPALGCPRPSLGPRLTGQSLEPGVMRGPGGPGGRSSPKTATFSNRASN